MSVRGRLFERGQRNESHRRDRESEDENHQRDDRAGVVRSSSRAGARKGNTAHAEYRRSG